MSGATMDSSAWDARYAGADLVWSAGPNVWVRELCTDLAPGWALDVAAGEGRNALWLVEQGWSVVAADFSPVGVQRMTEIADRRLGELRAAFTAVVADATQPAPRPSRDLLVDPGTGAAQERPSRDQLVDSGTEERPSRDLLVDSGTGGGAAPAVPGYDLVLISYLHLPRDQWTAALTAAVEACVPGGVVLVVAHALRNLTEGVGGPQDPAILLDPQAVLATAADLPVDVELAELRRRDVEGADRPALDTVVLLRRRAD